MSLEKAREKSIGMRRPMQILSAFLMAGVMLPVTAPKLWAVPFSQTKIIIEVNATAGDAGIQISVDGAGWTRLEVFDPNKQKIFEVSGGGGVGRQGVTELFFESAEPSFDIQTLHELFARFPEGPYQFKGTTVEGQTLNGKATLTHAIPDGPVIVSPEEDVPVDPSMPVLIVWELVTDPFPDTGSEVEIVGYQVIVERVKPQPLQVFSVNLPATATQVTVSPEFIQANAEYNVEVLAIESGGNQTISERGFRTH